MTVRARWNVDNGLPVQPPREVPISAEIFANGASREVAYEIEEKTIDDDIVKFHACGAWPPLDEDFGNVARVNALNVAPASSSTTSAETDVPPPDLGAAAAPERSVASSSEDA